MGKSATPLPGVAWEHLTDKEALSALRSSPPSPLVNRMIVALEKLEHMQEVIDRALACLEEN